MVERQKLLDSDTSPKMSGPMKLGYQASEVADKNPKAASFALRKIVMVGDSGVGKTAILSRFTSGWMPSSRRSTMGASEKLKTLYMTGINKKLPMQIWDITGADRFRSLSSVYYRDADAAILVCDVTDKQSFTNLKESWFTEMKNIAPDSMLKVIVGNKTDLLDPEEGKKKKGKDKDIRRSEDSMIPLESSTLDPKELVS